MPDFLTPWVDRGSSVLGGRWGEGLNINTAFVDFLNQQMNKSTESGWEQAARQQDALLGQRGLRGSGMAADSYARLGRQRAEQQAGTALQTAGMAEEARQAALNRVYGGYQREWEQNAVTENKPSGWEQAAGVLGGIAGAYIGGNPYSAMMPKPAQQPQSPLAQIGNAANSYRINNAGGVNFGYPGNPYNPVTYENTQIGPQRQSPNPLATWFQGAAQNFGTMPQRQPVQNIPYIDWGALSDHSRDNYPR